MKNLLDGIAFLKPQDEDVVVVLDGDDMLNTPNALTLVSMEYAKGKLMTHGSFVNSNGLADWINKDTSRVITPIRKMPLMTTSLRTFKYHVFKRIKDEHFRDAEGNYLRGDADQAVMIPAIEMVGKSNVGFVRAPIYKYRTSDGANIRSNPDMRQMQSGSAVHVRSHAPYPLMYNKFGKLLKTPVNESDIIDVTFCMTVKNRTYKLLPNGAELYLLPNCIRSIEESCMQIPYLRAEIVITDFMSTVAPVDEYIEYATTLPYKVVKLVERTPGKFNRGYGLNMCAENSKTENLIFLDADMLISPEFIVEAIKAFRQNSVMFPICQSYVDPSHTKAIWRDFGYGIASTKKEHWLQNKWPEYDGWGMEDNDFHAGFGKLGVNIIRQRVNNYFHQWHPPESDARTKIGPAMLINK